MNWSPYKLTLFCVYVCAFVVLFLDLFVWRA